MTWALGLLVLGTLAARSAIENRPILDILRGAVGQLGGGPGTAGFTTALLDRSAGARNAQAKIATGGGGTQEFDGEQVAAWIVPWLKKIRATGLWSGKVTSGYRTVAQQRQACIGVCGNPNGCEGTCAPPGESNHQRKRYPGGAVDVSDPAGFAAGARRVGAPLKNALGADDPVHFSKSGT